MLEIEWQLIAGVVITGLKGVRTAPPYQADEPAFAEECEDVLNGAIAESGDLGQAADRGLAITALPVRLVIADLVEGF